MHSPLMLVAFIHNMFDDCHKQHNMVESKIQTDLFCVFFLLILAHFLLMDLFHVDK